MPHKLGAPDSIFPALCQLPCARFPAAGWRPAVEERRAQKGRLGLTHKWDYPSLASPPQPLPPNLLPETGDKSKSGCRGGYVQVLGNILLVQIPATEVSTTKLASFSILTTAFVTISSQDQNFLQEINTDRPFFFQIFSPQLICLRSTIKPTLGLLSC